MKKVFHLKHAFTITIILLLCTGGNTWAQTSNFFYGFETPPAVNDWSSDIRVPSGTNSITAASGSWYGNAPASSFTRFGGYNYIFPLCGYKTSLDIYLDINGGWVNDTRVDYSSAISSNVSPNHRRDFVFHVGFYNDLTGLGANTNRFIISASNNSPGWPKNPARPQFLVSSSGWYTFEHSFKNNAGILAVDLTVYDASNTPVATFTLSDPSDLIGTTVGGNRYGWVHNNAFSPLAIDNAKLTVGGSTYYVDADNDGQGSAADNSGTLFCTVPGTGWALNNSDCNDDDATVYLAAPEFCNGEDDDCDGFVDEGFSDFDNDGTKDCGDPDDDNDGVPDAYDCEPLNKKKDKWLVCHNGNTICIAEAAVQTHLDHGDELGPCSTALRANRVSTELVYIDDFKLNNAPNPLQSSTTIRYELPVDSKVNITLYDPMGRIVAVLVEASRTAGVYNHQLDASKLASGIYYYKMTAVSGDQKFVQGQKLMIIK